MTTAAVASQPGAIERIGDRVAVNVQKWLPDPYLFAILLTFLAFVMGLVFAGQTPAQMVRHWYGGFWQLLTFAMHMALILITGYVLAQHPAIHRILRTVAGWPKTGGQAVVLVALVGLVFAWINWGFGLVLGAVMAREVAIECERRGIPVHYPVLCTAGYSGLGVTWHWGLSGSATLLSATPKHAFESLIGVVPTSVTIFSGYALIMTVLALIYVPIILYLIAPKSADRCRGISHWDREAMARSDAKSEAARGDGSIAEAINNSRIVGGLISIMALVFLVFHFVLDRKGLDLNIVIFVFLSLGLVLYLRPASYLQAFGEATPAAAGVLLQFPFYAGIMGMISLSGLGVIMAGWLINVATPGTFPVLAWLASGLVNIFVPSGGGEWAVLGETLLRAGKELGVPAGKTIIAFATGDAWTNLFQPFWAIALLGITRMTARDMFGYCIMLLVALVPFFGILLWLLPY